MSEQKKAYIRWINELMEECNDIALLDLIYERLRRR